MKENEFCYTDVNGNRVLPLQNTTTRPWERTSFAVIVAIVLLPFLYSGQDKPTVLEQAQRRLAQGADGTDVVEYATASLLKKLLHNPTINLRKAGEVSDEELIAAATKLFGIKKDP